MATDLDEILAKDGREWTDEESKIVAEAVKEQGRTALKARRKELRE